MGFFFFVDLILNYELRVLNYFKVFDYLENFIYIIKILSFKINLIVLGLEELYVLYINWLCEYLKLF